MKITKIEFETFWDAVLGTDWYVDEGPCPVSKDEDTDLYEMDEVVIQWQGTGVPEPTSYITARDLKDGTHYLSMKVLYRRWIKAQTTVMLVATFDVPKESLEALTAQIRILGGKIISRKGNKS